MSTNPNRRVLLIDDMPSIHGDFRKILCPGGAEDSTLDQVESALFGDAPKVPALRFELACASQGEEGHAMVRAAASAGQPYAVAFVDMRMPQGWDGIQTVEHLWQADGGLQIVICTAYSDTPWDEILARLDVRDRLLVLKKPFDAIEVRQLASSLCTKWELAQRASAQLLQMEEAVRERTREITRANAALEREIAERRHLKDQLLQSEKLASIGQLAAGVAHEINNPIGYVYSNLGSLEEYQAKLFEMLAIYEASEVLLHGKEQTEVLREHKRRLDLDFLKADIPDLMRESREGIERVRKIVKDLKGFSHMDAHPQWQLADLVQGIESTLNVVHNEVRHKADVVRAYTPLPEIPCLASEINQVVMNLVVNAAHAMGPERGTITIRTGVEEHNVWFEVADTGCGISQEGLDRIFDPFYTTKPIGIGTGLGLSLSYGIVQKHRGRIDVKSAPGEGSTFRVTLPMQQPASQWGELGT